MFINCFLKILFPYQPQEEVTDGDGGQCEWNADLHEALEADLVPLLLQDTGCRNVGRGTDRSQVSAEGRTGQKAEIEKVRLNSKGHRNGADHRKHRCNVGNVIDEGGDDNGSPDDHGIEQEQVALSKGSNDAGEIIDDADLLEAADDKENGNQHQHGLVIKLTHGMLPAFRAMGAEKVTKCSNGSEGAAEETIRDRGLIRKKRSKNQGNDNAAQHEGGKIIVHLRLLFTVHRLGIMTEEEHDDRNRCERAKFYGEEDTGASVHPEEMGEVHLRIGAEHDGGGITDQSGGTLQIGGNGD